MMIWANVLVIECILSFQSSSSQIPQFPETFLALQLHLPSTLRGKHAKNIECDNSYLIFVISFAPKNTLKMPL